MGETLPAMRAPDLDGIARLGTWLAASEVERPDAKQLGAAAALRIYFARELGLSPLAASELSVIRGRLVVSAKLLRARAAQYGYRVVRVSGDEKACTARLVERDTGQLVGETTFTIDDAKRAGIVRSGSGWEKYPARMLWARASKFVIDDNAPEASLGLILEDEAAEITGAEVTGETWEDAEPDPKYREKIQGGLLGPEPLESDEPPGAFVAPEGERGESGE